MHVRIERKWPKSEYTIGRVYINDTLEEVWIDIPDWEEYYQASTQGRIRSKERVINTSNGSRKLNSIILNPSLMNSGYLHVTLSGDGRLYSRTVHSLIADAFFGKREKGIDVDHINCNRTDNRLENLRIMTHKDNSNRALPYRKNYERFLEKNPNTKKVVGIKDGRVVCEFACGKILCNVIGMNYSTFKNVLREGKLEVNGIKYKYYESSNREKVS